jgi:NTE family protein
MRGLGEGPIIASDVSAAVDLRAHPSYTEPPTPWQYLSARFRRSAEPRPFPNILRLIHRAALLASDVYAKQAKREVELYLDLPVEGFDMFAMERLDDLVEFGYRFTRRALEEAPWAPEREAPWASP